MNKQETLEEAAESRYGTDVDSIRGSTVYDLNTDLKRGFVEGAKSDAAKDYWYAKWQQEQDRWKTVCEETPPMHVELLVKSPEGIVHLSSWRESWHIFSCQAKSESSLNWKWKTI
jgi:hypothetical protein